MVALALSERTAALAHVDAGKLWDAGIFAVVAAFVLSRVLLVLTNWKTFAAFPILLLTVPSLTAMGLLLTAVATCIWLWFKRVPLVRALNAWAPCAAVVWAALSVGHFAEGSDPGMPSRLPWAMASMPGEAMRLHPVAIYAAVFAVALAVVAYRMLQRGVSTTAAWTLLGAGIAQFLFSFLRQPGALGVGGLDVLECVGLGMILAGTVLLLVSPATME